MHKLISAILLLALYQLPSFGQNCMSERYKQAIFNDVTVTEVLYSTADAYDIFNQNNQEDYYMDIYEPTGDTQSKRPVVFMFFGGGFSNGDKQDSDIVAWCDSLARHGYVAVAVNYRLGYNNLNIGSAKRAIYRGMQDASAAIRYMLEFEDTYKIDSNHIYIGGKSSGGIISLQTTFLGEESDRLPETYTSTFDPSDMGCVSCSGNNYQHGFEIKGVLSLWGAILDTVGIELDEQVPTLMIHGDGDILVPYDSGYPISGAIPLTFPYLFGSLSIQNRMDDIGNYNEFYTYDYDNHDVYGNPDNFPNENWETIWPQGKNFLENIVIPEPLSIQGENMVIAEQGYSYTVTLNNGSIYCWDVTNGTIISQNNNELTVQWFGGMGSVSITEENCIGGVGDKATMEIEATTTNNVNITIPNVNVYPNVLNGNNEITIENNYLNNSIIQGRIMDISGRSIFRFETVDTKVSLPDLAVGMYFIELQIGKKKGIYKIIVNR